MDRVDLGAPASGELKAHAQQPHQGPTKAGFGRSIPKLQTAATTQGALVWQSAPDGGLVSLLTVISSKAVGVRLGIRVSSLPEKAELRFFNDPSVTGPVVLGSDILDLIKKNLDAGDPEEDARLYWSPVILGESLSLEIYLPPGVDQDGVEIAIPSVSHIFLMDALNTPDPVIRTGVGSAASCNNDVMCDPAWSLRSQSVARMLFTSGASTYLCTGTLLNDAGNSGTPYFLTANHCISTQTVASTLNTNWFFHSSSCNSGVLYSGSTTLSSGATLLYQSNTTDTSFLRLNSQPPSGVTYSGWTTATPIISDPSTGLHNPKGDLQKISYGQVSGFLICTPPDAAGSFTCNSSDSTSGTFANITYYSGITEGGSSGSGIFINNGQYLFGQLYGGNSSCANPSGSNIYGRFDKAYANGNFAQWLAPIQYSLTVSKTGTGTIISSPAGINCGATCSGSFSLGQVVTLSQTAASGFYFQSWSGACSGSGACSLTMDTAKSVTANFAAIPQNNVLLSVAQTGLGSITSVPSGINCNASCAAPFTIGSTVTLTPSPVTGYYFQGWGGACSGSGSCTVVLNNDQSVTANFVLIPQNTQLLTLRVSGSGSVTTNPSGWTCNSNSNCGFPFATGTMVSLIASPNSGQTFMGWSGACSGKSGCVVPMVGPQSVTATFQSTYTLIMPAINLLLLQ